MKVLLSLDHEEKKKLKAVYDRMTDESLLKRCLLGKTQNPNESLHSRIWKLCPKTKNLGKSICEFAVAQAVLNYNIGYKLGHFGLELEITISDTFNTKIL